MGINLQNAINVEKSRIDNLLTAETLDENSELIDIRTGYKGTIYDTAGNAVRGQISDLNDELENRTVYFCKDYDRCTSVGGGKYLINVPLKKGFLEYVNYYSAGSGTVTIQLIENYSNTWTAIFKSPEISVVSGINKIPIYKTIETDNIYFAFYGSSGTLYFKDNDMIGKVSKSLENPDFIYNYGFKIYLQYSNFLSPIYGNVNKYDWTTITIDPKNKKVTNSDMYVSTPSNTYHIEASTINYSYDKSYDPDRRCIRYLFVDILSEVLYVNTYPNHAGDVAIASFTNSRLLFGDPDIIKIIHPSIIMIGDSYAEGYTPDGNVTSWCEYTKDFLNLTDDDVIIKYLGGTGFKNTVNGKNFLSLLEDAYNDINDSIYDKNDITTIIVCGGYNDLTHTDTDIWNAIQNFLNYANNNFKYATIYVGMVGYTSDKTKWDDIQNKVLYTYQHVGRFRNAVYLGGTEYALENKSVVSDGYHPKDNGQLEISVAIKNVIKGKGGTIIPHFYYKPIRNLL